MGNAFVVVILLAGMAAAPAQGSRLEWAGCPGDVTNHPRQQCAEVSVPLDYRYPQGRQLTVTVSRILAADPARRLGTLILSPGGPGLGGLAEPGKLYGEQQPPELPDRYDLVGFDPRGVRHSSPITCGIPVQDRAVRYPKADGSIDHSIEHSRASAAACVQRAGEELRHITTANTARDLDRVRAALGESRISFIGLSYGTYLGAVYASLFPHRTERFVLDSAVDPTSVWHRFINLGGLGLAQRLPDVTAWIADRDADYGLGQTQAAVHERYRKLASALDASPISYPGLTVDGNWLRDFTRDSLEQRGDSSFELVAAVWSELASPGAKQARLPDSDNRQAVQWAVFCGDSRWPRDTEHYRSAVRIARILFPDDAGRSANITPCAFWPEPAEPPVQVHGHGPRNVLILQNLRDPATPWIAGLAMRGALGSRAAMVTVDLGGHGVIGANKCATAVALRFLAADDTTLPKDTFCH